MNRTILVAGIASLALAACGGGGGDDSAGAAPTVADASPNPMATVPDDAPVTRPTDDLPASDPVRQPDPRPAADPGALVDLYGTVRLVWSFTGTRPNVFSATVSYGPEDLLFGESGDALLLDLNAATTMQAGTGPERRGRTLPLSCSYADGVPQLLCIIDALGEDRALFELEPPVGGRGAGTFETCPPSDDIGTCVVRLLSSPDGVAEIRIAGDG